MLPTALWLASRLHPDPSARGRALGQWAAVAGAATVLGPLAGGGLVDTLSWRAIFFINVPIAVLATVLLRRAPHTPAGAARTRSVGVVMLWTARRSMIMPMRSALC
ncbi:hypothetical protein GCM10027569_92180 [Flindersiella endophytica]